MSKGPSQRQLRVGELVRRALSDVLMRGELNEPGLDVPITVSEVRMTPDLRTATAYVMPIGGIGAEEVLEALTRARGEARRQVTRSVSLKYSPEIRFALDETFDRMDETRRMLSDDRVRRDVNRDVTSDVSGDGERDLDD